jgi:hypothetical protein
VQEQEWDIEKEEEKAVVEGSGEGYNKEEE